MSITKYDTKHGTRWRVRYTTPNGRRTDKRGFKTKADAKVWQAQQATDANKGTFVDPKRTRTPLEHLYPAWEQTLAHLKPSTRETELVAWRVWVEPKWAHAHVGAIRPDDIQAWVNQISETRSPTTTIRAFGVLNKILKLAVRDNLIHRNPCSGIKLPRKTRSRNIYLTHQQVHLLANQNTHHKPLIMALAYTGMRWGEAAGVQAADVDTLKQRIHLHRNMPIVRGKHVEGTLKSHKARTVPLPRFLNDTLKRVTRDLRDTDHVFTETSGSILRQANRRDGWWAQAVKQAQQIDKTFPTVTPHDLRHTTASLAISAGANVKAVQRMLGHASAAMTLDVYADLFDDDLSTVADAFEKNVGKMWAKDDSAESG